MRKCKGCRKELNPVEVMMGPLCGTCVRYAHRVATGEMTYEEMVKKQKQRMGRYDDAER